MGTSVDQLKTISLSLSDYYGKVSSFASSGLTPPAFEDYIAFIDYPNILDDAVKGAERSSSYSNGALADTVHQAMSVNREFAIRTKTKAQYYADAVVDSARDSDFYKTNRAVLGNMFRATSPDQTSQA